VLDTKFGKNDLLRVQVIHSWSLGEDAERRRVGQRGRCRRMDRMGVGQWWLGPVARHAGDMHGPARDVTGRA
jgi:hypothetical protein